MTILVFNSHSLKEKHGSIAVDGFCFRFNRANVQNYAQEFRCCDDQCPARVLFNSCDDFIVLHDHVVCQFDHKKELRSRKRLDKAFDLVKKNLTDPPHKIVEMVQLLLDEEMTAAERHALRTFITRKRRELLGRQSNDPNELVIPDHLRITATPVSPENPDNSFLLFDSIEHEKDAPSRILIFASADMRFKASMATELFADGTYRIVPSGFATLYTIHSIIEGVPYGSLTIPQLLVQKPYLFFCSRWFSIFYLPDIRLVHEHSILFFIPAKTHTFSYSRTFTRKTKCRLKMVSTTEGQFKQLPCVDTGHQRCWSSIVPTSTSCQGLPLTNASRLAPHQLQPGELCQLRNPLASLHRDAASLRDSHRPCPGWSKMSPFRFIVLPVVETAPRMSLGNNELYIENLPTAVVHLYHRPDELHCVNVAMKVKLTGNVTFMQLLLYVVEEPPITNNSSATRYLLKRRWDERQYVFFAIVSYKKLWLGTSRQPHGEQRWHSAVI